MLCWNIGLCASQCYNHRFYVTMVIPWFRGFWPVLLHVHFPAVFWHLGLPTIDTGKQHAASMEASKQSVLVIGGLSFFRKKVYEQRWNKTQANTGRILIDWDCLEQKGVSRHMLIWVMSSWTNKLQPASLLLINHGYQQGSAFIMSGFKHARSVCR